MTLRKKILITILFAAAAAIAGWAWLVHEHATAGQEEALEKIVLLGPLRADWYHAEGSMSETEARRLARGAPDQAVHLLFLGVDRRKNEQGRADAIHLLRFEPGRITLFSLPRDSIFSFHGDTVADKLNHTYAAGGAAATIRAIETLLKIKVDGYLEVDLQSFSRAAQIAKTLTLDGRLIGAEELFEHIDGMLSWLRNRSFPGGDIRRIARQHLFIMKSLDWILTLYENHPDAFRGIVNGTLKLLPGTITARQVMVLCQIYSTQPADDISADTTLPRHTAIRTMERFILPGQPILIDIQSGHVVPPPVDTRAAAPTAVKAAMTLPDTSVWHVWRGEAIAHDSAVDPLLTTYMEETGVISFYRIERDKSLDQMLAEWRAKGIRRNYEDKDELLK